jgi:hypothetical protein
VTGFERCQSLYWAFTHRCNDRCPHCYNRSGPDGETMPLEECLAVLGNLPPRLDRLILSGGEPLIEFDKLLAILDAARERYRGATQLMLQTNGDLLDGGKLDLLLAKGVTRIDVASMDRHHRKAGARQDRLTELFTSRGLAGDDPDPLVSSENYLKPGEASYGFWGATEDLWLQGNWPRGRALETGRWTRDGGHNFCAILSGGRGFLSGNGLPQEVAIQLWRVHPCCPGTFSPLGDARREPVPAILARAARAPAFRKIDEGNPYALGEHLGLGEDHGRRRARALGSVCLWCDEFFRDHGSR